MENVSEVKTIRSKPDPDAVRRDPNLAEGECAETPKERKQREQENARPKEPPIIQSDVT
jgi:hypothetical protein